ncbi:DUF742 domain-containing protein [Amycolatopsis sp. H20-H5]|uniref:DUF742 domain-containing protein n=1 Tax=Amycolatopsis sp. H20-H5 TaxID=3046309 RepID=UPI002DB85046|nr:DUF742 domain-containing protein [Amycolatopsis sp. H20-H5]MEC3973888.1 DUF742 domain-containing protein [Amycolatopsis sp. H20-H5]
MSTGSGSHGEEPGAGEQPPYEEADDAAGYGDDGTFADVFNGFALDSGRGRRKRKKNKESRENSAAGAHAAEHPTDQGDRVTSVVSPPGSSSTDAVEPRPGGLFDPGPPSGEFIMPAVFEQTHPAEETSIVRPYALTGGRTKSNYALELETLVSTREFPSGILPDAVTEQIESLSIMEECRTPRSVAEVASALRVPLGVARVLISDAADAGLVTVHKTLTGNDGAEAHLVLMERVLSGLRRL